ncbi:MAG: exosortase system-associated protein, TIGR04073 family [Geobacter sp.]|nr:exosortase system-associated protein, TIGR04073 family [Geobacter sp.]
MNWEKLVFALILFLCMAVSPGVSRADSYKYPEAASPQEVVDGMSTKLVRGASNVALGWLEFPKQIYITFKEDGVAKGIFVGPFKGVGMTLVRTVSGAGETVTFFLPYPGFFDPYFGPPYAWQME